jgi:molybdate transport system substrate-binding protein
MRIRSLGALVVLVTLGSGCGAGATATPSSSGPTGSITVFAASSLTAAFTAISTDFESTHPTTSVHLAFAGSSTLAAQIQQGATGDLIAMADQVNMQALVKTGLLAGTSQIFAHNRLQIVVGKGNPKHIAGLTDLSRPGLVVVLCAPAVPCGRYAGQALRRAGVSVTPASQETDVKAVLGKVALDEADAGIVYLTDAAAGGARVQGVDIEPAFNIIADYPIAVLKDSHNVRLARAFIDYVLADGQGTLSRYGFTSL